MRMWSADASSRIVLSDSFSALRHSVAAMLANIERIVLDRPASSSDYVSLLAELPREFNGDVLMIRHDETGFLSMAASGGDRVLYALSAGEVRFYLEANQLAEPGGAAMVSPVDARVLPFRARTAVA